MKTSTRAFKLLKAKTLPAQWALLSRPAKAYARHLVSRYGWTARGAIQHAYIFGYDVFTFDYHAHRAAIEESTPQSFGYRVDRDSMRVYELNDDQMQELAQSYLVENYRKYNPDAAEMEGPSWGELADALQIVGRETLVYEYMRTIFTSDDFFCTASQPSREPVTYELRQVDAWAEYDDPDDPDEAPAWVWNTSYHLGTFTTTAKDHARAFRAALARLGVTFYRGRTVTEYDGNVYEIVDRKTREPLFAAIPTA